MIATFDRRIDAVLRPNLDKEVSVCLHLSPESCITSGEQLPRIKLLGIVKLELEIANSKRNSYSRCQTFTEVKEIGVHAPITLKHISIKAKSIDLCILLSCSTFVLVRKCLKCHSFIHSFIHSLRRFMRVCKRQNKIKL